MLTFEPGATIAHRFDPRAKLAFQLAFAAAAFAHTTPRGLVLLSLVTLVVLAIARVWPTTILREFRFALVLLAMAPLLEGLTWGPPWFSLAQATGPAMASYRVGLLLLVSGTYIRTTPVRDSRAAIQRTVPGRPGRLLGTGVGFVFRFLPVLQADLGRIRAAMGARLGTERRLHDRMRLLATVGIARAFDRAEAFSLALQARCFAWNPTLPPLSFAARDGPVLVAAGFLALSVML